MARVHGSRANVHARVPDIAEGAQQSGPGSVWHPSGFGRVEAEASHSGHFSSLSPFSCLSGTS